MHMYILYIHIHIYKYVRIIVFVELRLNDSAMLNLWWRSTQMLHFQQTYPSKIWIAYIEISENSNKTFSLITTFQIVLVHGLLWIGFGKGNY